MKLNLLQSLILFILLCAAPQAFGTDEPLSCADRSIVASAVRTTEDVQAFVRCAQELVQEAGTAEAYRAFHEDDRWRSQSIYLFGLDTYGNPLFSGDPYSQWWGILAPELNDYVDGPFGGRDVVSVGNAFGETFLYYSTRNPSTGMP